MQLSNGPAERLAQNLIESSKGAFDLCGFVSGGVSCGIRIGMYGPCSDIYMSRIGGHGSRDQALETGPVSTFHCS